MSLMASIVGWVESSEPTLALHTTKVGSEDFTHPTRQGPHRALDHPRRSISHLHARALGPVGLPPRLALQRSRSQTPPASTRRRCGVSSLSHRLVRHL